MLSVLGELQEATESAGLDALTRVALEADQILAPFQLPRAACQDFPERAGVDEMARDLYPADAPTGLLPLKCKGGGNLLFDAVSVLLAGSTNLSLELQVSDGVHNLIFRAPDVHSKPFVVVYMRTMSVILTASTWARTGANSCGNGVVEEILPVWDDRFKDDASGCSLQSVCRRV